MTETVSGAEAVVVPVEKFYADTAVLTPAECRAALKVSETHWYEIAPSLPVSYALGKKSPRYIWGQILKYLERTGAAA
jgi:hypothetical protein